MSKVKINGKEYDCHSYSKKNIEIGHSLEIIIEGSFKPLESNRILVERCDTKFNAILVLYHNYDDISKIFIYVEG